MPVCASTCSKLSLKLDPSAPTFCLWPFCSEGANYWEVWQWFCWGVHLRTDSWTWLFKSNPHKLSKPVESQGSPCTPHRPAALQCCCGSGPCLDRLSCWQFCLISRRCQAATEYTVLQGSEWIWSSSSPWGSAMNPHGLLCSKSPSPWELAPFKKYGILHLGSSKKANTNKGRQSSHFMVVIWEMPILYQNCDNFVFSLNNIHVTCPQCSLGSHSETASCVVRSFCVLHNLHASLLLLGDSFKMFHKTLSNGSSTQKAKYAEVVSYGHIASHPSGENLHPLQGSWKGNVSSQSSGVFCPLMHSSPHHAPVLRMDVR